MSTFKPHPQLLIDLINAANSAAVPYSAVTLSGPVVNEDVEIAGDTLVTMSAVQGSGYTGEVTASYSRLDFQQLFAIADIQTLAISTNVESTHDMVDAIRNAYGLSLFAADIVDEPITYLEGGTAQVTLTAAADSYLFSGSIEVAISPVAAELASIFTVTVLNGLNYPLMDTDHLTAPVITVETLSGDLVKGDGTMQVGVDVPASGYLVINNSEMTMAVAARVHPAGPAVEPIEGAYLFDVPDDADWNVTYSLSVPASAAARPLTALYAVSLEYRSVDLAVGVVFDLVDSAEGYVFRSEDGLAEFAAEYVNGTFEVAQGLQVLQSQASYFVGQPTNTAGALLGQFEIILTARRLNSIAPVLTLVAEVTAVAEEVAPE